MLPRSSPAARRKQFSSFYEVFLRVDVKLRGQSNQADKYRCQKYCKLQGKMLPGSSPAAPQQQLDKSTSKQGDK